MKWQIVGLQVVMMAHLAFAQSDSEVLQTLDSIPQLPADSSPRVGNFYTLHAGDTCPPLPANVLNLPFWDLGDGNYLIDDRNVNYSQLKTNQPASQSLALNQYSSAVVNTIQNSQGFDPNLKQESAGLFYEDGQLYAEYKVSGAQPYGCYFVTSMEDVTPFVGGEVWKTHTYEGWFQNGNSSSCSYWIPVDTNMAKFYRLGSFDGTYYGLFAPISIINSPVDGEVIDVTTNQTIEVRTFARDIQAVQRIVLTIDGLPADERDASYPADPTLFQFKTHFLPSGQHTLVQTVYNFGEFGAPTNAEDSFVSIPTTSEPVTFTVSNNFAYIHPTPMATVGGGYAVTIETPWADTLLTLNVVDDETNVIQVLANMSGSDRIVSFAWDGNDANGNVYTKPRVAFNLNVPQVKPMAAPGWVQGPYGSLTNLNVYISSPPCVGKLSCAYQNLGLINNKASGMLNEIASAADTWASWNFGDMRSVYRDHLGEGHASSCS